MQTNEWVVGSWGCAHTALAQGGCVARWVANACCLMRLGQRARGDGASEHNPNLGWFWLATTVLCSVPQRHSKRHKKCSCSCSSREPVSDACASVTVTKRPAINKFFIFFFLPPFLRRSAHHPIEMGASLFPGTQHPIALLARQGKIPTTRLPSDWPVFDLAARAYGADADRRVQNVLDEALRKVNAMRKLHRKAEIESLYGEVPEENEVSGACVCVVCVSLVCVCSCVRVCVVLCALSNP